MNLNGFCNTAVTICHNARAKCLNEPGMRVLILQNEPAYRLHWHFIEFEKGGYIMNPAHLHLIINHFPLIGFVFALLIYVIGLILKNEHYIRSGLFIFIVSGLFAAPTYLTGEPAEEIIHHSANFSERLVEQHEDAAQFAILFIELTTVASLVAFYFSTRKNRIPNVLMYGILFLGLFALVVTARTNNLGGKISHTELRSSTPNATPITNEK
jgi:uncharacterized membrane protein